MLGPPAGDLVDNPPGPHETPVLVVVIATVGDHAAGAMAGPAGWAVYVWDRVYQRDQLGDVVAIGRGRRPRKQSPPGVGQDVVLDTRPPAVDRARPEPGTPFFAWTYEESTIARDQSI